MSLFPNNIDKTPEQYLQDAMAESQATLDRVRQDTLKKQGLSSYQAAEALELTNIDETHAEEDGKPLDQTDIAQRHGDNVSFVKDPNVVLDDHGSRKEETKRTTNLGFVDLEEQVRGVVTNERTPLTEKTSQIAGIVAAVKEPIRIKGFDTFFSEAQTAKASRSQRLAMMAGYESLALMAQGYDQTTVDKFVNKKYGETFSTEKKSEVAIAREKIEGKVNKSTTPVFDPIDTVVDFAMPGVAQAVKKGFSFLLKSKLSNTARTAITESLLKQTGKSVLWGGVAGGFMTLADFLDSGETVTLISGIVGPLATGALITGTRVGVASYLGHLEKNNPKMYYKLRSVVTKPRDKFATILSEAFKIKDTTGEVTDLIFKPAQSAAATMAEFAAKVGDDQAIDKLKKAVITKHFRDIGENPVVKTIDEAFDTGAVNLMSAPLMGKVKYSLLEESKTPQIFKLGKGRYAIGTDPENITHGARTLKEAQNIINGVEPEVKVEAPTVETPKVEVSPIASRRQELLKASDNLQAEYDKIEAQLAKEVKGNSAEAVALRKAKQERLDSLAERLDDIDDEVGALEKQLGKAVEMPSAPKTVKDKTVSEELLNKWREEAKGKKDYLSKEKDLEHVFSDEALAEDMARGRMAAEQARLYSNEIPTGKEIPIEPEERAAGVRPVNAPNFDKLFLPGVEAPKVQDPKTDLAVEVNNASTISAALGPHIFYDVMSEKQTKVKDIIYTRMRGDEIDFGPTTLGWENYRTRGWLSQLITPMFGLKDFVKDLIRTPTLNELASNRMFKSAKDAVGEVFKGLSRDERKQLIAILEAGDDMGEMFIPHKNGLSDTLGNIHPATPQVIDSYFAMRSVLDHMHFLANQTAVRQARTKGFKLMEDNFLVWTTNSMKSGMETVNSKGEPVKWSSEAKKRGDLFIQFHDENGGIKTMILTPEEAQKMLKDLPNDYQMIGYRKGYLPREYKNPWAITMIESIKGPKGGIQGIKARRIATANTALEAQEAVKRLKEQYPDGEFVGHRKSENGVDMTYDTNYMNTLKKMSPAELEAVSKVLKEAGIEDEEVIRMFQRHVETFSYKRTPHLMQRGEGLVTAKSAQIDASGKVTGDYEFMPTEQALAKYINGTSRYVNHAEWNSKLEKAYLEKYGNLLDDPHNWRSGFKPDAKGELKREAFIVKDQLNRIIGVKGMLEQATETWKNSISESLMRSESPSMKQLGQLIDNAPHIYAVSNFLKQVGAVTKLGLFNLSQLWVQGSAILNVVGRHAYHPHTQVQTGGDIMAMFANFAGAKNEHGEKLTQWIKQTGFLAGIDYDDLGRMMKNISNWSGIYDDGASKARSMVAKGVDLSNTFWKGGEAFPRLYSLLIERRTLIDKIKAGKDTRFNMKDIDTDAFNRAVADEASVTALNMTRFNQAFIARGPLGTKYQFKQFAVQQLALMLNLNRDLTAKEVAGLWFAWFTAFGYKGIPFFLDLATWGEDILAEAGYPDATGALTNNFAWEGAKQMSETLFKHGVDVPAKFFKDLLSGGALKAATGGTVDIANRATIALMFNHYSDVTDAADAFGPGFATLVAMAKGSITKPIDLYKVFKEYGGMETPELVGDLASTSSPLSQTTGISNPMIASEAFMTGKLKDRTRSVLLDDPTAFEVFMQGTGTTPGRVVELRERNQFIYRAQKAWGIWASNQIKTVVEQINNKNNAMAVKTLEEARNKIAEQNPAFMKTFNQKAMTAMLANTLPKNYRAGIMASKHPNYFSQEELTNIQSAFQGGN